MIDPAGAALRAASSGSALAYPLLFAAGAATSIGPCVVPRYLAVAALAHATHRPRQRIAAYVAGIVLAYVLLGVAAGALGALWRTSGPVYAALSLLLAAAGIMTLLHEQHPCGEGCAHRTESAGAGGLGAALLLGAASAFVVSPCCTPLIASIAGLTVLGGRAADGAALLASFALGHVAPLLAAGSLGARAAGIVARATLSQAPAVIAGTLMLALSAYYGLLA